MTAPVKCSATDCMKEARAAIRTVNNKTMYSTIYFDNREAPKAAAPYCKEHAQHLAAELVKTLTDEDGAGW